MLIKIKRSASITHVSCFVTHHELRRTLTKMTLEREFARHGMVLLQG